MTIRPIAGGEVELLSRLTVDAYTNPPVVVFPDEYLAELADVASRAHEALVLVAVDDDDALLGGIAYVGRSGRWAELDGPEHAELRMLAVAQVAQGQGVGRRLVQACIDQAVLDGKRRITLHTASCMIAAQRLYERAGFRRQVERDLVVDGGIQLFGYILDLDG